MISMLKKQYLMIALIAVIATPLSAMDAPPTESTGWFGWKAAAVVAGAAVLYYWMQPDTKPFLKELPPATFEVKKQNSEKNNTVKPPRPSQKKLVNEVKVELEVSPLADSDEVKQFSVLGVTDQKIEIVHKVNEYVASPSQECEDLITQFAVVYCRLMRTTDLNTFLNKLFAAQDPQTRQDASKAIKNHLGLLYY